MRKTTSLPFAVARDGVRPIGWSLGTPDNPGEPVPERLESWDAAVKTQVHCRVRIDPLLLQRETGLAAASKLRLCSGWFCESTRTREIAHRHEFSLTEGTLEVSAPVMLVGRALARSVELESRLVLVEAGPSSERVAARIPGSVLWASAQDLVLEGVHARFPMEWADFTTSVYQKEASWALDWDPHDLNSSTLGSVKLLLNQCHPVSAPLLREDPPSDAARLLWETIHFDVARQLIEGALSNDDFVADPHQYADGMLGATIRRMLFVHFSSFDDLGALRALVERSRTQFETMLQASLHIYGERR